MISIFFIFLIITNRLIEVFVEQDFLALKVDCLDSVNQKVSAIFVQVDEEMSESRKELGIIVMEIHLVDLLFENLIIYRDQTMQILANMNT